MLDPTEEEENNSTGRVVIAYMPSLNEVTQLFQFGEIEYSKVQEVLNKENIFFLILYCRVLN